MNFDVRLSHVVKPGPSFLLQATALVLAVNLTHMCRDSAKRIVKDREVRLCEVLIPPHEHP